MGEMKTFVIFLVIGTYMFAVVRAIINPSDHSAGDWWITLELIDGYKQVQNKLNMSSAATVQDWVFFVFNSILTVLVLMPLLISIIGAAFVRVFKQRQIQDYQEKTALCLEYENLMFWRRGGSEERFLHVVRYKEQKAAAVNPLNTGITSINSNLTKKIR